MSEKWISWFQELGQEYSGRFGKKCANLGEMAKIGQRVPPGFALSLEASTSLPAPVEDMKSL